MADLRYLQFRSWLARGLFLAGVILCQSLAHAETRLDFWHSYSPPTGIVHYSFQLASYKRGVFFGSCGPSTRSLKWEYDIDLEGIGPVYTKEQIKITSDAKPIEIVSGTISIEAKQSEANLRLRVRSAGGDSEFVGNGTHRIKKLK
ncbi:MAG TPA: hypothetical protein VFE51_14570 [Verrucomicrobiae bacterium]|nr:hypothetical protein [Verrucomicrobiae bacterium]